MQAPPTRHSKKMALVVRPPPSVYYHIQSKQTGCVLEIQSACAHPRTYIVVNQKSTNPEGEAHQMWYLEDAGNGYFYIVSKLNSLVVDIKGASSTQGAYLIMWHRKSPPENVANQKWKFEGDTIVSQLNGQVLEVRGASTSAGAYVVMSNKKEPLPEHQHWSFVRLPTRGHKMIDDDDDCAGEQSHRKF